MITKAKILDDLYANKLKDYKDLEEKVESNLQSGDFSITLFEKPSREALRKLIHESTIAGWKLDYTESSLPTYVLLLHYS